MKVFEGEQGLRLLRVIRESDNEIVSFHCGYSAEQVYKMIAFPNVPTADGLITDRNDLIERITNNFIALEKKINEGDKKKKKKSCS